MNLFDIKGKVAVVTGGSGTLGGSISKYLAVNGVKVAVIGRTHENVDLRLGKIEKAGGEGMGLVVDVLNVEDLQRAKDEILK
jgi:NAD(P)-dependent dehydrogenase (short-subunit alcohol dehydrogenase family)